MWNVLGAYNETLVAKNFVLPLEKRDVHVCNFEAIWSGNWAAAYFSSLVRDDCCRLIHGFPRDQVQRILQQKDLGARFRNTFLSLGGSYPAAEVFRKFRRRDPSSPALLGQSRVNASDEGNQVMRLHD
ncbi:uncharacterized protein LOC143897909 isoform X2 [Temnothorax americanus]|uniref:uncharacterized protein LOC143897909 isoform X2 n=1 Tax=Temnothorax americanus TaxID=1964332 RepID=UPI004067CA5C